MCNCRFHNAQFKDGHCGNSDEYDKNPCEEFLYLGTDRETGKWTVEPILKTAFTLKHWAFARSLTFLQETKLAREYRYDYLITLRHCVRTAGIGQLASFAVRALKAHDRETWLFEEICDKGLMLTIHFEDPYLFPKRSWCESSCNGSLTCFCTSWKTKTKKTKHFFQQRSPLSSESWGWRSCERYGHYNHCRCVSVGGGGNL